MSHYKTVYRRNSLLIDCLGSRVHEKKTPFSQILNEKIVKVLHVT